MVSPESGQLEDAKDLILNKIRIRRETDKLLSPYWAAAPVVGIIISIILIILSTIFHFQSLQHAIIIGIASYVISIALLVYPLFHLIKRRTVHFKRDSELRRGILQFLRAKAEEKDFGNMDSNISAMKLISEISTIKMMHIRSDEEEDEKPAALWTILSFLVPFSMIYVLYFLTKDPQNHDQRQVSFYKQVKTTASRLDMEIEVSDRRQIEKRSFALYFIVSMITFGLFQVYWYYQLITDFNRHFKAQWEVEDQIVSSLEA
ncbi:hypothetical protein AKJ57_04705 [candidate division MSBL1 archaeon SCGC-AAA259A05]|uniref:DUF4234 domain-containing protein n=1 Tax=candidate division MSBL1 archaeon SCGC-AAA259A05 TaxID=1698259 RepID=A0A133U6X6_9EURY|nr:hypothetical protein AKJ57_04705 [candidate division MSBL1 archaeon SCGC-AAA259A05]